MIRVLVDGRVQGSDGIGRYTGQLTRELRAQAGDAFRITVLDPTPTPRYTRAEERELAAAARSAGADIVHVLDYRSPPGEVPSRLIATIHDVLRALHPQFCYTDDAFIARSGRSALDELALLADAIPGYPAGAASVHQDYYARMLALTCARADRIIVPTRVVAGHLAAVTGRTDRVEVSAFGADHLAGAGGGSLVAGRYLLYVGQARAHKGLTALLEAYTMSGAARAGVALAFAGRDFAPGEHGADLVTAALGPAALPLGEVGDGELALLYTHAEALTHLAEHEGFGFTPVEALAHGTRVIASDIPVLRETLGSHAVFCQSSPAQVAHAIDDLLAADDTPLLRRSRQQWAARYRWACHAADVLHAYRLVMR